MALGAVQELDGCCPDPLRGFQVLTVSSCLVSCVTEFSYVAMQYPRPGWGPIPFRETRQSLRVRNIRVS